jgi:PAS domain S-box-containing protein
MQFLVSLLDNPVYIDLPIGLLGWLGWLLMLAGVVALAIWNLSHTTLIRPGMAPRYWGLLLILFLLLVPLTSLTLVLRLPAGDSLPPPGRPVDPLGPGMILLIALPFTLGAGMLGSFPAFILGLVSGLMVALWDTHNPFTPLEFSLLAMLFSACVRQRYSAREFRWLRIPVLASGVIALIYPVIFLYSSLFFAGGNLANRLDYAFTHLPMESIAMAGELLLAGALCTIVAVYQPLRWGSQAALHPSPMERSLPLRFLYNMAPLALILLVTLLVGNWFVAGNAARQMLQSRMSNAAELAAETIPFFLESGHSLIQQLAEDPAWLTGSEAEDLERIKSGRVSVPFFNHLVLLDAAGEVVLAYPNDLPELSEAESNGIALALLGVPIQNYAIAPIDPNRSPTVSFLAAIFESESGQVKGVLIGHADITLNPFTRPILFNLNSMQEFGGDGILLDSESRVFYHTSQVSLGEVYPLPEIPVEQPGAPEALEPSAQFYEDKGPDGTRRLVYYQPAIGQPWSVILAIPARQTQQLALTIASPMLLMILVAFGAAAIILVLGLRLVTQSLENLARQADLIASGNLDHPLVSTTEDEVGRLSRSFEQMRLSLQTRLDELNRLLTVSQGVASSLEITEAVKPVLEAALSSGASAARIVLTQAALPEIEGSSPYPSHYGAGPEQEAYAKLDDQVLALARQQDRLVLNNMNRVRLIQFPVGAPRPEALLAMALRHENAHFGVLWLGFEKPHTFTPDELRFIATLASQTALAVSNARLFLNAEAGRQRLSGILASSPDPVLVTDPNNRLLLSNPAAWQAFHLSGDSMQGQPIERIIFHPEMVELLSSSGNEKQSAEITLAGSRVYLATASSVVSGGRQIGRVCVMRDITYFKELDALKSEFVATVSHDLRSPLTLMRGYATMLEMVGDLNEQQTSYVKKIIQGVESMARLVNNLLDLGRIEAGVDLQLEKISIPEVVERVMNTIQPQAVQKQIQLTSELSDPVLPPLQADAALLTQALQNLMENAVKYTDPGGKVHVKVQLLENAVQFEVSDTGIGVAPVDQTRLFERFYRGAQRDARKRQGSGLGLAIVKSIAERHGGRVWVNSQLGKGSTFGLEIPLQRSDPSN